MIFCPYPLHRRTEPRITRNRGERSAKRLVPKFGGGCRRTKEGSPPASARRSGANRSRLADHERERARIMAELHVIPTAKTLKVGAHKRRSPQPAERPK